MNATFRLTNRFALTCLFTEDLSLCWVRLFWSEQVAKRAGIDWYVDHFGIWTSAMSEWSALSLDAQWEDIQAALGFSEWLMVLPVEVPA